MSLDDVIDKELDNIRSAVQQQEQSFASLEIRNKVIAVVNSHIDPDAVGFFSASWVNGMLRDIVKEIHQLT